MQAGSAAIMLHLSLTYGRPAPTGLTLQLQAGTAAFGAQAAHQPGTPESLSRGLTLKETAPLMLNTRRFACRKACNLDEKYIVNFGEEIVRGQPVFMLSILLQCLEPILRQTAGVAPWQVRCLMRVLARL